MKGKETSKEVRLIFSSVWRYFRGCFRKNNVKLRNFFNKLVSRKFGQFSLQLILKPSFAESNLVSRNFYVFYFVFDLGNNSLWKNLRTANNRASVESTCLVRLRVFPFPVSAFQTRVASNALISTHFCYLVSFLTTRLALWDFVFSLRLALKIISEIIKKSSLTPEWNLVKTVPDKSVVKGGTVWCFFFGKEWQENSEVKKSMKKVYEEAFKSS